VETVTSAARTVTERATGIAFTVTHQFARTPEHDDLPPPFGSACPLEPGDYRAALSTFAFALYGTTCEVTTSLDRDPRALDATTYLTSPVARRREAGFSFARGTVLAELTRLVAEHGAVPVWVHAPSAPPALVTAEHSELAGLSIGPYIRLAMSNSREHGDARIAFEVAVWSASTSDRRHLPRRPDRPVPALMRR